VLACLGIQPKNVRTQTGCLTGVSCYFLCTSKLTVCVGLYEFAAAGRWRWIEATARANTFVYALGDVATYNRMLCVGLFWPIICFPTDGELVAVALGLACSLTHLPHSVFILTRCGSVLYHWKIASHWNMNSGLAFAHKRRKFKFSVLNRHVHLLQVRNGVIVLSCVRVDGHRNFCPSCKFSEEGCRRRAAFYSHVHCVAV